MASVIGSYRQALTSAGGAQPILGGFDGVYEVTVRALSTGIFIGSSSVAANLPDTGFELIQGKDYTFTCVAGSDHEPYLATTLTSAVYSYVFFTPKI